MSPTARYVALYVLYVAALHAFDGPWRDWKRGRRGAIDKWTLTHLAWGALAARMGVPEDVFMALGAANELGEYAVRRARPDLLWGSPESGPNVLTDVAANWIGYKLGRRLPPAR